jgi:hypothetical protein
MYSTQQKSMQLESKYCVDSNESVLLLHQMSESKVMGNFTDGCPTPVNLFSNFNKN